MSANLSDKGELFGIQMLRGLAALAVVTHHTLEQSNGARHTFSPDWLTTSGASGVDIFFVISGFIMLYVSFPNNQPPVTPVKFIIRRVTRIYPFYWICCTAMVVIMASGFLKHSGLTNYDRVSSLLLMPSYGKYLSVSWTLVYEIYFYVIFASFLVFRSRAFSVFGSSSVICAGLLLTFAPGAVGTFFANPIPLEFCMGLFLAWGFCLWRNRKLNTPLLILAGCLGFAALAGAPLLVKHESTAGLTGYVRVVAWGVPAVMIVTTFPHIGAPRNPLGRALVLLGDASYALYLTHQFVMDGYAILIRDTVLGTLEQIFVVPLVVASAIAVAIMAHFFVERPVLRLIRQVIERSKLA